MDNMFNHNNNNSSSLFLNHKLRQLMGMRRLIIKFIIPIQIINIKIDQLVKDIRTQITLSR